MHSALAAAVDNLIAVNPAAKARPPTAKEAKSPEMQTWDADQLRTFLDWTERERPELYPAWLLLAMTGMRRGEALAVRWGDVDFDTGTLAVRRSAVLVKAEGEGERLEVGPPKSGKSRVIDLDGRTLAHCVRTAPSPAGGAVAGPGPGRRLRPRSAQRRSASPRAAVPGVHPAAGLGGPAARGRHTAGNPAARPAAHPRHASPARRRAPEDRQRAPGARHHLDHLGRLPVRAADAAARGRCPGGRPHLRRLTGARFHRSITNPGSGYLADLAGPLTCSNVTETTCGRGESNPHARRHQILSLAWLPLHHSRAGTE